MLKGTANPMLERGNQEVIEIYLDSSDSENMSEGEPDASNGCHGNFDSTSEGTASVEKLLTSNTNNTIMSVDDSKKKNIRSRGNEEDAQGAPAFNEEVGACEFESFRDTDNDEPTESESVKKRRTTQLNSRQVERSAYAKKKQTARKSSRTNAAAKPEKQTARKSSRTNATAKPFLALAKVPRSIVCGSSDGPIRITAAKSTAEAKSPPISPRERRPRNGSCAVGSSDDSQQEFEIDPFSNSSSCDDDSYSYGSDDEHGKQGKASEGDFNPLLFFEDGDEIREWNAARTPSTDGTRTPKSRTEKSHMSQRITKVNSRIAKVNSKGPRHQPNSDSKKQASAVALKGSSRDAPFQFHNGDNDRRIDANAEFNDDAHHSIRLQPMQPIGTQGERRDILKASRTRQLDVLIQKETISWAEQDATGTRERSSYLDAISHDSRRIIASKVPTSVCELSALGVLPEEILARYGARIVLRILSFLQQHDISVNYVRKKRSGEVATSKRTTPNENKSRQPTVMIIDSDDENSTVNEPGNVNAHSAKKPQPSPIEESEWNPFGGESYNNSKISSDKDCKDLTTSESQARRRAPGNTTLYTEASPTSHDSKCAAVEHQYSSSSDGDFLLSVHSTDRDDSQDILGAEHTKELNDYIKKASQTRASLEQKLGNTRIHYRNIISDDTRRRVASIVPISEAELNRQGIRGEPGQRDFGSWLITTIRHFLQYHGISVDDIKRRRFFQQRSAKGKNSNSNTMKINGQNNRDVQYHRAESEWNPFASDSDCHSESELNPFVVDESEEDAKPSSAMRKRRKIVGSRDEISNKTQDTAQKKSRHQTKKAAIREVGLLNQGYCAEWIDKDGHKLCLFGTISKFFCEDSDSEDKEEDKTKKEWASIEYSEISRNLLNQFHTQVKGLFVPPTQTVDIGRAWGGCLVYQEKQGKIHLEPTSPAIAIQQPLIPLLWRVPDLYTTATMSQESTINVPSLCLHYATFQLEFTVRHSTIPNSGNGVFLSITSLLDPPASHIPVFSLRPGEVLDIGVYAPLTSQDETDDHIMLLRSFLQNGWCDGYSMNTRDNESVYDITHGRPELDPEANGSVLPFVNERIDWKSQQPEIQLLEDPQGSFHYCLGYRDSRKYDCRMREVDGVSNRAEAVVPFQQLADGNPREVFVDYGTDYELVRIRHGYPRIPIADEKECKRRLDQDEREKLEAFIYFSGKELQGAVDYLSKFVTTLMEKLQKRQQEKRGNTSQGRSNIRERVLAATVVLYARSEQLSPERMNRTTLRSHRKKMAHATFSGGSNVRTRNHCDWRAFPANDGGRKGEIDFEGMALEDWERVDSQLQEVVKTLSHKASPSSLSSLLLSLSREAIGDSLLGMAWDIAQHPT